MPSKLSPSTEWIRLRGVRVHNLQNLDLDIPRDCLVVITGKSGSGKSSLALDTIYAEGQRQYLESLSAQARAWLPQLERPDVDLVEGLQPTIAIDQRAGTFNPRSTVATVTEIHDHLRLLWARLGTPHCPQCGAAIRQQSAEEIVDELCRLPEGTRAMVMAPLVRGRKGDHRDVLLQIRKAQLVRVRVDGHIFDLDMAPDLDARKTHHIEAVVDRIVVRPTVRTRIAEAVQLALRQTNHLVLAAWEEPPLAPPSEGGERGGSSPWQERLYSTVYACPNCGVSVGEVEPRTFSFSSPYGACPDCDGLGCRVAFDAELVLDPRRSLEKGALAPWRDVPAASAKSTSWKKVRDELNTFCTRHALDAKQPLAAWPNALRQKLLSGEEKSFPGVLAMLEREWSTAIDDDWRNHLESFRSEVSCAKCGGTRLRMEARAIKLASRAIHEITALTIDEAAEWFAGPAGKEITASPVGQRVVPEIRKRLQFLRQVGLDYLTLDRSAQSLSGGELQRVRLATGIGAALTGVCYVLDEPSIGLHSRDNARLLASLRELVSLGNSVLVVEHDEELIRQADWLLDLGPSAGRLGGKLMAQGAPRDVADVPDSPTGRFLSGTETISLPAARRPIDPKRLLVVEGAAGNNLRDLSVRVPLSVLVCVTGVSGSGKSTLVHDTLARAIRRELHGAATRPAAFRKLSGLEHIDKLVQVDQSPLGRSPRSNAATYTGLWDEIRKVFASTKEAKSRGYKAARFSFNLAGGRCEVCQGQGLRRIEMNFLPDMYVTCAECQGKRFNPQTLQVHYRGRSIGDILEMPIDEAREFFDAIPTMARLLESLREVGLGYLRLGQPCTTLSGGEAQRVKLATELARVATGKTLYILDEPTTGLHLSDIRQLLTVLQRLVELGNTMLVIEHHLDVIKNADWVIDLGPEGGAGGGQIVAEGTPEEIAAVSSSHTGKCLKRVLGNREALERSP